MKPTDRNYQNDRRAGVTDPDKIEIIGRGDPRHLNFSQAGPVNRGRWRAAGRRRAGLVCPPYRRMGKRRAAIPSALTE